MQTPPLVHRALANLGIAATTGTLVWTNAVGGRTFAVDAPALGGTGRVIAKWNPTASGESLAREVERLAWLRGRHPVPEVIGFAADDAHEVMVTRELPGASAVDPRWQAQPRVALRALGEGLRQLHELPIDECPFVWGVATRLRDDGIDPAAVGPVPEIDRLVVCQGDPCAPNTLIDARGAFVAHVDLARCGVADRWADLAVMSMSLDWNFEDFDEAWFWDAYGVTPDRERVAFYRRLWEAAPD